jgi:hypothetical protein
MRLSLGLGLPEGAGLFNPAILFANGEQGAWFDPADLATMFQDDNGLTPGAFGQTVGLHLDKSKSLARGSELFGTGAIANVGSPGTATSYDASTGVGSVTRTDSSNSGGVSFAVTAGYWYLFDVEVISGSPINIRRTNAAGAPALNANLTTGRYQLYANADTASALVIACGTNGNTVAFKVWSIKRVAGNHAYQATAASRPILACHPAGGRRNLLTQTQFASGWTLDGATLTPNSTTNPAGNAAALMTGTTGNFRVYQIGTVANGTTYTISTKIKPVTTTTVEVDFINVDNGPVFTFATNSWSTKAGWTTGYELLADGWYLLWATRISTTTSAGPGFRLSGTTTAYIGDVQLEASSAPTAYQKVVSAYEITEAGVQTLYALVFDGVDDGMLTNAMDFSVSDKVTVWAGLRKLSDAAVGIFVELSATSGSNNGTFFLAAPISNSATSFSFYSNGTSGVPNSRTAVAPVTAILTGIGNISGPSAILRLNGDPGSVATSSQGTGNFGNYPLYIGRRGGTALPFNGYLYGIVIRGGASSVEQVVANETWLNTSRVRAY